MSNDRKVHGELSVFPPLTWAQIRAYRGAGGRVRDALELVIDEAEEENDLGTYVVKTCSLIRPENWEHEYGVVAALEVLASVAPGNEFVGDFTIVDESPEFDEDPREPEAKRYSISEGQHYVSKPVVTWSTPEPVNPG